MSDVWEGFFLGVANGATCLAYCAPVLTPMMLGAGQATRRNWLLLAQFLSGRLVGYLLFGLLAWASGQLILTNPFWRGTAFGFVYVVLAALLLYFGLAHQTAACAGTLIGVRQRLRHWPMLLPLGLGFFTGLNLCPPFLLAFANAAYLISVFASLLFFFAFFLGTSIYLLPFPFLGAFQHHSALSTIGKMAAVLMALYYLCLGIFSLAGGFAQL
jgi:sulfite exporter TauE/SafE